MSRDRERAGDARGSGHRGASDAQVDPMQQAREAVQLAEGIASMPGIVAQAEHAIAQRAYGAAMAATRAWYGHKPHIEMLARSIDPTDRFVARAQALLDRMRPLEAKLPKFGLLVGIPELDQKDKAAWLAQLGDAPDASSPYAGAHGSLAGSADGGLGQATATGKISSDGPDAGDIVRGIAVPWWAQDGTTRRQVIGADRDPVSDGADQILGGLIDDPAYASGFAVGAFHGTASAIQDTLRGPYDLAKLALELTKKLALYQHLDLLRSLRDMVKLAPAAVALLGERWSDDSDRHAQGEFQGEVVGYIGTQLAILIVTAAAEPLAELAGPYAAVIRALAAAGDPLSAVREVAMGARLSDEATAAVRAARRAQQVEDAAADAARGAAKVEGAATTVTPGAGGRPDAVAPHAAAPERTGRDAVDAVMVHGAGQKPTTGPWRPNAGGAVRSLDEVADLARTAGIEIPDDIQFMVARRLPPDVFAEYLSRRFVVGARVRWEDLLNRFETVSVRLSPDILSSDEAIVAVVAHEMHELNSLRTLIDANGGSISAEQLHRLVSPGIKGNLHDRAWEEADAAVQRMRRRSHP